MGLAEFCVIVDSSWCSPNVLLQGFTASVLQICFSAIHMSTLVVPKLTKIYVLFLNITIFICYLIKLNVCMLIYKAH